MNTTLKIEQLCSNDFLPNVKIEAAVLFKTLFPILKNYPTTPLPLKNGHAPQKQCFAVFSENRAFIKKNCLMKKCS